MHGTHTASTAAGRRYGVAGKAEVVAVQVLDCTGESTEADVAAGDRSGSNGFGPNARVRAYSLALPRQAPYRMRARCEFIRCPAALTTALTALTTATTALTAPPDPTR